MMNVLAKIALIFMLPTLSWAVIDLHEFDDPVQQKRYLQFIEELRCPKCQNQNLAGSNSPIAEDLRRELHRLLEEGKTDKEIVDFMVARYGEYVLYRPQFKSNTYVLWGLPVVALVLGLFSVLMIVRGRSKRVEEPVGLSAEEQERIKQITDRESP